MTEAILNRWIIVKRTKKVPYVHVPQNSNDGVIDSLRELIKLYPDAQLTLAMLAFGNHLWVEDGNEYLETYDIIANKT